MTENIIVNIITSQLETQRWMAFPDFDESFIVEAGTQQEAFDLMSQELNKIKDKFIEIDSETKIVRRMGDSIAEIVAQRIKEKLSGLGR